VSATPDRLVVVLDRDGTINVERHYLSDPDQIELLPGAAAGLRRLRDLGALLVVVTNQSGVGRGYFDEARLAAIHERLAALLAAEGVTLDAFYHCPHVPEDGCDCRKPEPGMIRKAAAEWAFDPSSAFVVGDKPCDVDLGRSVGAQTLLVRTGYGARHEEAGDTNPDHVVNDLAHAADVIIEEVARRRGVTGAGAVATPPTGPG
jgi:D-glycero-D-manno-heptose 1,7-bisphosphate phosphatase